MKYYTIGHLQSDDTIIYVSSILTTGVGITLDFTNALSFTDKAHAKAVCDSIHEFEKDETKVYQVYEINIDIKEVK